MNDAFLADTEETNNAQPGRLSFFRFLLSCFFALTSLFLCLAVSYSLDAFLRTKERNAIIASASPELNPQKAQELLERANLLARERILPFGIQRLLPIPKFSEPNSSVFDLRARLYKATSANVVIDVATQDSLRRDVLALQGTGSNAFVPLLIQSIEKIAEIDREREAKKAESPPLSEFEKDKKQEAQYAAEKEKLKSLLPGWELSLLSGEGAGL